MMVIKNKKRRLTAACSLASFFVAGIQAPLFASTDEKALSTATLQSGRVIFDDAAYANAKVFIDLDEWRSEPRRHRYVHGGFEGTNLRFSIYLPPAEYYKGRFLSMMEGGAGGQDKMMTQSGWRWAFDLAFDDIGAYLMESNEGHFPTESQGATTSEELYRAHAHAARFARRIAGEMYGHYPAHGYIAGCSGGGVRSSIGLENAPDIWDGAVPQSWTNEPSIFWSAYLRVRELLSKEQLKRVIDSADVGGVGRTFDGLGVYQREALSDLLRLGYPRQAISALTDVPIDSVKMTAMERVIDADPAYFENFWKVAGYAGHDTPDALRRQLIDTQVRVSRLITAEELRAGQNATPIMRPNKTAELARLIGTGVADGQKIAAVLDYPHPESLQWAKVTILTGADAGKSMYMNIARTDGLLMPLLYRSPEAFNNVQVGDIVRVDNRDYLALLYYYRHGAQAITRNYLPEAENLFPEFNAVLSTHDEPVFPQQDKGPSFAGMQGKIEDHQKVIMVTGTADPLVWPTMMTFYPQLVRKHSGPATDDYFRFWWVEYGAHCSGAMQGPRSTQEVDSTGIVAEAIRSVVRWREESVAPAASVAFTYTLDMELLLESSRAKRGGIQPVVQLLANNGSRAEVKAGETVKFSASAALPRGAGRLLMGEWDFDGQGTWPLKVPPVEGSSLKATAEHRFERPGTYFVTFRSTSSTNSRSTQTDRIYNIARVRVVVK